MSLLLFIQSLYLLVSRPFVDAVALWPCALRLEAGRADLLAAMRSVKGTIIRKRARDYT